MDFYSLFKILQKHPLYKLRRDSFHHQVWASRKEKSLDWDEFSRRLKEFFPELMSYLESQRNLYKTLHDESLLRRKQGHRFVVFGEDLYPAEFYRMSEPPLTLSYLGHPCWRQGAALSVVGSREPREETLLWMEQQLSAFLDSSQVHVVSGGARGVDQKAHSLAIRKNLPTSVVLPSGLGAVYPSVLKEWIRPVLNAGGCFISEYDHEQKMQKFLFHHRNRLIASLGKVILIAEARRRSGTLITAQQGAQWGRPVLVVPGHPSDTHFGGSLDLLSEGATLVRDAQDLDIIFRSEFDPPKGLGVSVEESLPT